MSVSLPISLTYWVVIRRQFYKIDLQIWNTIRFDFTYSVLNLLWNPENL